MLLRLALTCLICYGGVGIALANATLQCVRGFRTNQSLTAWETQSEIRQTSLPQQQLYPSINFSCSGTIARFIIKAHSEVLGVDFNSYTYPELQIWRQNRDSSYRKVGSVTVDLAPQHRSSALQVYVITPSSPMEFEAGDILGIWEGATITASTRGVDKIYHITTSGYSYEASSPQTTFPLSSQLRQIGTPLVAVETDGPTCNSFVTLETLATCATRTPCCNSTYYLHIIPEMSFNCDGNITRWTAGATWVQRDDTDIAPLIQIWRKAAEQVLDSGDRTYTRVASVPFNPIPPQNINYNGGEFRKRLFTNVFDPPINVRRGDVIGLVLSSVGQMKLHLADVPFVQLPRNYIFTSRSGFTDVRNIEIQAPSSTASMLSLQPVLSLDFSAESFPMETTPPAPPPTTPPTTTTVPSTSTTSSSSSTTTLEEGGHTTPTTSTTDLEPSSNPTTSATKLLESKHVFAIIVSIVLFTVLVLVLLLAVVGVALFVRARKRGGHFVETFIETTDNDAYRSRTTLLAARTNRRRARDATPTDFHDVSIATTSNVAYWNGQEVSRRDDVIHPTTFDPSHTLEMKVNEAYNMEVGNTSTTRQPTLPQATEDSPETMVAHSVEVNGSKSKTVLVKPYEVTLLPGVVDV